MVSVARAFCVLLLTEALACSSVLEISSTDEACWLAACDRLCAVAETSTDADDRLSAAPRTGR